MSKDLEKLSREELITLIHDMRARQASDSEASARAALLDAAMDAIPAAISVKDEDGRYLVMNRAVRELLGVSEHGAIGGRIEDLVPRSLAHAIRQADRRILSGETLPATFEQSFAPSGDPVMVRTSKAPLRAPGTDEVVGVVTISINAIDMDIDAARLDALIRSVPFPLYFKDREARFTVANRALLELYGAPTDNVVGLTSAEAFGAPGHEYVDEDLSVLRTGETFTREITLAGKQHMVLKFPVRDSHGHLLGVGGTEPSIADLKEMEEALTLAKTEAEMANRAKSQFLAMMSHELRTPLNAIIGFASIMRDSVIDDLSLEQHRDYAADIAASASLLLELINDMLDLSKAEAGTLDLEKDVFDAAALVRRCIELAELQGNRHVPIRTELPDDRLVGYGDERRIRQVLSNLIHNARKFTENGEIVVRAHREPKGAVTFMVKDTGIGIEPSDLPGITEPFSQGTVSFKRRAEGAGLGLWLSRTVVEAHDGVLDIASQPRVGTTVRFSLPPRPEAKGQ
ncbi:PAS domain-containing protein [Marivibrio halodurans]|uniref:histidine kinase n=1 Tax=Marivibrio halodurans TaxID=2039722 RepID=A0A8J7RYP6_9PROT|nr:ATP-binding protein [Marivibrio halodurans]MBP5855404.1 PAS domain-containing protein [Marivibrio halodurans]